MCEMGTHLCLKQPTALNKVEFYQLSPILFSIIAKTITYGLIYISKIYMVTSGDEWFCDFGDF